jgi:type I restriction-modification system DNA methylase subunit
MMEANAPVRLLDQACRILSGDSERKTALYGFIESIDARPSYEITNFDANSGSLQFHIAVEQELSNCAVFSFLNAPRRVAELSISEIRGILNISYNNVVDRHVVLGVSDFKVFNNRANQKSQEIFFGQADNNNLIKIGSSRLNEFTIHKKNIEIEACDDAVISTIKHWRTLLTADYGGIELDAMSAFFNLIIFLRTIEDTKPNVLHGSEALKNSVAQRLDKAHDLIERFSEFSEQSVPQSVVDDRALWVANKLETGTLRRLVADFYNKQGIPYSFDFRLLSLRAMSKIYERYVALFRAPITQSKQISFINPLPEEESSRKIGSVYTPSYIAAFFARYCLNNITPSFADKAMLLDPACGSGVFLRTFIEERLSQSRAQLTQSHIRSILSQVRGYDIDGNAVNAAKLSLSLLQYQYTSNADFDFSNSLQQGDAIAAPEIGQLQADIFISNPPYKKYDSLTPGERERIGEFLGGDASGRLDTYLAFVKLALQSTRAGGFICLILPDAFLSSTSAAKLRSRLLEETQIRCIADISSVDVFGGVGVYPVLLIAQKPTASANVDRDEDFLFVRARALVGRALEACLNGSEVETEAYSITKLPQSTLNGAKWVLGSRPQVELRARLRSMPVLAEICDVSQGFITGDDEVFLRPIETVPMAERSLYLKYLPDKEIQPFKSITRAKKLVFYPFLNGELIEEGTIESGFPNTWSHLMQHEARLRARKAAKSGYTRWWKPAWPRSPRVMLRPKIVTPHLSIAPRFLLDLRGGLATSHSPIISAKIDTDALSLLKAICCILNSTFGYWLLTSEIRKYSKGYRKIEVSDLKNFRFPRIMIESSIVMKRLIAFFDRAVEIFDEALALEIDEFVYEIYEISSDERAKIWTTFE